MMYRSHLSRAASGRRKQPWYVGSNGAAWTNTTIALTGLSGGYWSSLAENDIVVVASLCNNAAQNPTISTSGYTTIVNETQGNLRLVVGYKVMGSTPDTGVVVATTDYNAARAWCFKGVHTTSPIDATTTIAKASSTAMDNPAITTVRDAAIVLAIGASAKVSAAGYPTAATNPANMVALGDSSSTTLAGFPVNYYRWTIDASYIAQGVAGSYNPAAWTNTTDMTEWIAATVALRPA